MSTAALVDGIKVVAAAGTALALVAVSTPAKWVMIAAHEANTGDVTVGASTTVHSAGDTQRGIFVPEPVTDTAAPVKLDGPLDLKDVYVDVAVSGDSVTYVYLPFGA